MEEGVYHLGTIADRHDMPVDGYLLNWSNFGDNALGLVTRAADSYRFPDYVHTVKLYYTGYTIATMGAVLSLVKRGYKVIMMEYSNTKKEYSEVHIMNHPLIQEYKSVR